MGAFTLSRQLDLAVGESSGETSAGLVDLVARLLRAAHDECYGRACNRPLHNGTALIIAVQLAR